MKITREALKRIIIQEMNRMEDTIATEGVGTDTLDGQIGVTPNEEDEDPDAIGEISEGIENITPENLAIVFQALGQMAGNFAPSVIAAALAMPLMDAIKYLRDNEPPKPPASRDDY